MSMRSELIIFFDKFFKAKIEKANLFYDSKLKEKYFPMIGLYVQTTKEKKENYFKAEEVFKYNQLSKFYSLWAKNYEISIEYQMNNRIVSNLLIYMIY